MTIKEVKSLDPILALADIAEVNFDRRYVVQITKVINPRQLEILAEELKRFGIKALIIIGDDIRMFQVD